MNFIEPCRGKHQHWFQVSSRWFYNADVGGRFYLAGWSKRKIESHAQTRARI